tara:strand:+ start:163 stop:432 length:270 start_codon:yes stop_codon:yes gene_type:complete
MNNAQRIRERDSRLARAPHTQKAQIRLLSETLDKTREVEALIDSLAIPGGSGLDHIIEGIKYKVSFLYRDIDELREGVIENEADQFPDP